MKINIEITPAEIYELRNIFATNDDDYCNDLKEKLAAKILAKVIRLAKENDQS